MIIFIKEAEGKPLVMIRKIKRNASNILLEGAMLTVSGLNFIYMGLTEMQL